MVGTLVQVLACNTALRRAAPDMLAVDCSPWRQKSWQGSNCRLRSLAKCLLPCAYWPQRQMSNAILTCSVDRRFCGARPCIQIRFVSISCSQKAKHWVGCRQLMRACSRCGVQMMHGIAS